MLSAVIFSVLLGAVPAEIPAARVSVVKLIATPNKFEGKRVAVSGIAREKENGAWVLYFSCESALANSYADGLSFRPSPRSDADFEKIRLAFITVTGTFHEYAGQLRGEAGSLQDVADVEPYPLLRGIGEQDLKHCVK